MSSENFSNMQAVLRAYDELGGADAGEVDELEDIVSPYRRLLCSYELLLKEAPFAESSRDEAKVYVFNDILLVALNKKALGKKVSWPDC